MPDTGRFEPRMPGPPDAPADWHDAFAALPAETPSPDGWQRLRARLPAAAPARRARVATVDAALSQPDLTTAQRTSLWDTRVDALQQLVGIEATQRLYAARGQSYDAALVTID